MEDNRSFSTGLLNTVRLNFVESSNLMVFTMMSTAKGDVGNALEV